MVQVIATTLPKSACLNDYEHHAGVYTDCFQTELPKGGTLESYINAFFNTWLFRIERMILSTAAKKPVSDEDIARLAQGTSNTMSAWQVERRDADQILLEVPQPPIRTWLMRSGEGEKTSSISAARSCQTRLIGTAMQRCHSCSTRSWGFTNSTPARCCFQPSARCADVKLCAPPHTAQAGSPDDCRSR